MRHRAVEGHAAVQQIAKCRACVRRPLMLVGLIAQRYSSVCWGGWAGHEPTAATYQTHKGLLFSLHRGYAKERGQHRYRPLHGGGDQREPPTQVSASAMSASPPTAV